MAGVRKKKKNLRVCCTYTVGGPFFSRGSSREELHASPKQLLLLSRGEKSRVSCDFQPLLICWFGRAVKIILGNGECHTIYQVQPKANQPTERSYEGSKFQKIVL